MMRINQTDCFRINMAYWKLLGIYPKTYSNKSLELFTKIMVTVFVLMYSPIVTLNFFFLPTQMDVIIEEIIFYVTEITVWTKVISFLAMRRKISHFLDLIDDDLFQPSNESQRKIIETAMHDNRRNWKIIAVISFTSNLVHVLSPLVLHLALGTDLQLPLCSYSFLSEEFIRRFIYILFFYQAFGMHLHMLNNVNMDTFIWGVLILTIGQLDILREKLEDVTKGAEKSEGNNKQDKEAIERLNKCVDHYERLQLLSSNFQDIFSVALFGQFGLGSLVICVCLFRFTLPAPWQYYIFLLTYMIVMIVQIVVPCWFGTRVMDKSSFLAVAAYRCNWTSKSKLFKLNLKLLIQRVNQPITIMAGKMFVLSLTTFGSIMNTAYSFFALLRHMQARQNEHS